MRAIVVQLQSCNEELRQVSAIMLRNLSWHPDTTSKDMLREVGAVAGLVKAAMVTTEEKTLKNILYAIWNLSAHSPENKSEICAIEGALGYLVNMLSYQGTSDSQSIVEAAGGILKNISCQIAVRDDYREVLRQHNCLEVLVKHLQSSNLTILIHTCGIVWNLSARCFVDQSALIKLGAVDSLTTLTSCNHKQISSSASAALRNIFAAQKQSDAQHSDTVSAIIVHKHQDFLINNIDVSTICDESLFYENICEYLPTSNFNKVPANKLDLTTCNSAENHCSTEKLGGQLSEHFKNLNVSSPKNCNPKPTHLPPAPKLITSSPRASIPVRNNFTNCAYEDEGVNCDQPIDYSSKYAEIKVNASERDKEAKPFYYAKASKENKNSGIYAETDLDQLTDYSLQYAEDDLDSEGDKVQDTVKTYCTEDTPYVTPFNFSNATSMSDIRIETKETSSKTNDTERDAIHSENVQFKDSLKRQTTTAIDDSSPEKTTTYCDAGLSSGYLQRNPTREVVKSSYSSGIMSPEKPVSYCDEGTPGYLTRVSSYSSLNSEGDKEKGKVEDGSVKATETSTVKEINKTASSPAEGTYILLSFTFECSSIVFQSSHLLYFKNHPLRF